MHRPTQGALAAALAATLFSVVSAVSCGMKANQTSDSRSQRFAAQFSARQEVQDQVITRLLASEVPVPLTDLQRSLAKRDLSSTGFFAAKPGNHIVPEKGAYVVQIPWKAHRTQLENGVSPLWLFVEGEDSQTQVLHAYDAAGKRHVLDAKHPPQRPVITVSLGEGVSPVDGDAVPLSFQTSTDLALSQGNTLAQRLDAIRIDNIEEPWFKGPAEVFALATFFDGEGKGHTALIPLLGVTEAYREYQPNKLFHFWIQNRYQIVDVAFFEHDSEHNYAQLGKVLLEAAGKVTGIVRPDFATVATLVTTLLSAIIDAMPKESTTDANDFLDVHNTLVRSTAAANLAGTAGNVVVSHSTFELEAAP